MTHLYPKTPAVAVKVPRGSTHGYDWYLCSIGVAVHVGTQLECCVSSAFTHTFLSQPHPRAKVVCPSTGYVGGVLRDNVLACMSNLTLWPASAPLCYLSYRLTSEAPRTQQSHLSNLNILPCHEGGLYCTFKGSRQPGKSTTIWQDGIV